MPDVLLGLGANLGDPVATIGSALHRLDEAGVAITRGSRLYRTAPQGVTDQPDFVNMCAAGRTDLVPLDLLAQIQRIEAALGRERRERWGPRTIDIDILTYGDAEVVEPGLTIPHPRLLERAFVLVPLLDIAPDRIIAGRTVRHWAAAVDRNGVEALG